MGMRVAAGLDASNAPAPGGLRAARGALAAVDRPSLAAIAAAVSGRARSPGLTILGSP